MPAAVVFVPNNAGLAKLLAPGGPVYQDILRRTLKVESAAKVNASGSPNVDTGRYRSSIQSSMKQDARGPVGVVGAYVSYALDIELGTRPHVIRPKRRKALYWKGARHPVKRVNHPGTRPYYVLRRALSAAR